MGVVTVQGVFNAVVASGAAAQLAYPAGMSKKTFERSTSYIGHAVVVSSAARYTSDADQFTLSFGADVLTIRNTSGAAWPVGVISLEIDLNSSGALACPTRVMLLGDSLTMRNNVYGTGTTVASVSGTDVTLTISGSTAPVGTKMRLYNQADLEVATTDAVVISRPSSSSVVVRYPFNVVGRLSGTTSYMLLASQADTGYFNFARGQLAALGKFVDVTYNGGIGGDTTEDILDRIEDLVETHSPEIVVVLVGVNDLDGTENSATIIANLERIYRHLLRRGVSVHAGTVWPVMSGDSRDTANDILAIKKVNAYIKAKCLNTPNMRCWDGYAALKDSGSEYATTGYLEASGVHALVAGAQVAGAKYVTDCGADYRVSGSFVVGSAADGYVDAASVNVIQNPLFAGSAGTSSGAGTKAGTIPDNWSVSATGGTTTTTPTARSDVMGNDLRLKKAATGPNVSTLTQDITSRVLPGQRLRFGAEISTVAANTGHRVQVYVTFTVEGVSMSYNALVNTFSYASGGRVPTAGTTYLLDGPEVIVPDGFSAASFSITIDNGASGDTEIQIGRPYVRLV